MHYPLAPKSLTTLALACLTLLAAPAMSAGNPAAEARARAHIAAFPGHSLHGQGHAYDVRDVIVDDDGSEHVRFERRMRGLRVIGGDLVVHGSRSGGFLGVSKSLRRDVDVDTRAAVRPAQALAAALAAHPGLERSSRPELVIHARGDVPVLAYEVLIDGEQDDGTPSEKHVIVDARDASIIETWDDVHTAPATGSGRSFFNGNVALGTNSITGGFELRDPTRGGQRTTDLRNRTSGSGTLFTDADNTWGNNALSDRATIASDAHYGATVTWDYFKNEHGRNGIRNDGVGALTRVHYGRNYANAFWSDSCFCMTYGDGNGSTVYPLTSLDIAGHEMTHGVTANSARLIYSGESGGLNEATSDIFGTMVEYYANNANDPGDYKMGEEIFANGTSVIRYMYKPSLDGVSADCWYSGVGSIDVHYSSGIANHFFYLLAEGTNPVSGPASPTCAAGNTRVATGNGFLVGIGRVKAAKIWYRALTVHMTSSTNYAGARAATITAANFHYGSGSAESNAVAAAWAAVLVN